MFCQRNTGSLKFQVEMSGDKEADLSRAASLLALGCMATGESPADYAVWVPAEEALIHRITRHAEELLHVGRSLSSAIDLSPREGEVLEELLGNRINKEIADRLSISVRTVKFHVSSLFTKFGVNSRWDLIRKARHMLGSKQLADNFANLQAPGSPHAIAAASQDSAQEAKQDKPSRYHGRVVPFRGQLRPA